MNEFEKLKKLLKENDILFGNFDIIYYPWIDKPVCRVMYNPDTELLDMVGLISDTYYELYNSIIDNDLTAEEVFKKIKDFNDIVNNPDAWSNGVKEYDIIYVNKHPIYIKNTHRPTDIFSDGQLDKLEDTIKFLMNIVEPNLKDNSYWHYQKEIKTICMNLLDIHVHFKKEKENRK